jgi:hypothetical protein
MAKETSDEATFAWIVIASVVVAIIVGIAANTGSFWKDFISGIVIGFIAMVAISSAFMK